jgi:hypothetical protein
MRDPYAPQSSRFSANFRENILRYIHGVKVVSELAWLNALRNPLSLTKLP